MISYHQHRRYGMSAEHSAVLLATESRVLDNPEGARNPSREVRAETAVVPPSDSRLKVAILATSSAREEADKRASLWATPKEGADRVLLPDGRWGSVFEITLVEPLNTTDEDSANRLDHMGALLAQHAVMPPV